MKTRYRGRAIWLLVIPIGLFTKKAVCSACAMKFESPAELQAHAARMHTKAPVSNAFACNCGVSFGTQNELMSHAKQYHMK